VPKRIFITGGSSGLGLELAKIYQTAGNEVAVCSFESQAEARRLIPQGLFYYQADVTDAPRMREVVTDFASRGRGLDLVVANAGISMKKTPIPDFERGRRVLLTNVLGVWNTFEPAILIMKEQGRGQLAAMSSLSGVIGGLPGMAAYCASKAAVVSLCESLEIDLYRYGIHVTTIAPGFIETPMTRENRHAMPFKLSQDEAARQIHYAIESRKGLYLFPWPMRIVAGLLALLPRGLYKAVMKRDWLGLMAQN
jgi:NAD(P)-dependent dehydrogenase (short-subunit alcohol dehydrogenase family)